MFTNFLNTFRGSAAAQSGQGDTSASPEFQKLNVGPSNAPTQNKGVHLQGKGGRGSRAKTSSPMKILGQNKKGVLGRGRSRSPSPARAMMPQESPKSPNFVEETLLQKIEGLKFSVKDALPGYDSCLWEPSQELAPERKSWKDNRWKQILKNPYVRVFALAYFESSKPCWCDFEDAPNYECCLWEPSGELAPERKTWKDNRWKQILKNSYVHVYSLDYFESSKPRWTISWNAPNYECCLWEPSEELAPEHKTWKDNRWKQILKNPYVRVYALAYYESALPLWETPVASYEACTWEANLSHEPRKTWKDNSWKQILRNPYTRVYALDYFESSKPRWSTTKVSTNVTRTETIKLDRQARRAESFEHECKAIG
mmetsp:Transcript_24312/g.52965  ORF Transcript_24312/g.52965 Transcript_24312/m.52965 type:complete len:370 (-) Transcript_24312:20-1129(-)